MSGVFNLYVAIAPDGRAYVGCTSKSVRRRWAGHWANIPRDWPGQALATVEDAIKRFGRDSFTVLHVASAVGAENAAATEEALIAAYNSFAPNGYNRTARSGFHVRPRRDDGWDENGCFIPARRAA